MLESDGLYDPEPAQRTWFVTVRQYPWIENGNEIQNTEMKCRDSTNGCRS